MIRKTHLFVFSALPSGCQSEISGGGRRTSREDQNDDDGSKIESPKKLAIMAGRDKRSSGWVGWLEFHVWRSCYSGRDVFALTVVIR